MRKAGIASRGIFGIAWANDLSVELDACVRRGAFDKVNRCLLRYDTFFEGKKDQ